MWCEKIQTSPLRYANRRLRFKLITLIRYGELTNNGFFVTEAVTKESVLIISTSSVETLVMLKHLSENRTLDIFTRI